MKARTDLVRVQDATSGYLLARDGLEHSPDALRRCIAVVARILRHCPHATISKPTSRREYNTQKRRTELHNDLLPLIRVLRIGERRVHVAERPAAVGADPDGPVGDCPGGHRGH